VVADFNGQADVECPKSGAALDNLVAAVRDRLALLPRPTLEVA
jgi:hypothetical protein